MTGAEVDAALATPSADRWVLVPLRLMSKCIDNLPYKSAVFNELKAALAAAPAAPEPEPSTFRKYMREEVARDMANAYEALGAAPAAPAAEPYAFVQHVKGYAPRLFLASEVGLDFPDQEWAPGVSVEPLYRGATPAPAQSREPLTMLTDEQIEALNHIELDRECYEVFSVNKRSVRDFAHDVIAEFCKINGIGSQP